MLSAVLFLLPKLISFSDFSVYITGYGGETPTKCFTILGVCSLIFLSKRTYIVEMSEGKAPPKILEMFSSEFRIPTQK